MGSNTDPKFEDSLLQTPDYESKQPEISSIAKHLSKLEVKGIHIAPVLNSDSAPLKKAIIPLDNRSTPKRKSTSPIITQDPKKRLLSSMVPPKFAEVAKASLFVVDIVLDGDEDVLLSPDQGKLIFEALTTALFASDKLNCLGFEHCAYERGLFRTISLNAETRDWITRIIPTLTFKDWQDAKLKTVEAGSPPKLVRASITLEFPTPEFGEVFDIIDARNVAIKTKFWRLYQRNKVDRGKQTWFIGIDEESAKIIKEMNFHVQYGLNKLKISILDGKNGRN